MQHIFANKDSVISESGVDGFKEEAATTSCTEQNTEKFSSNFTHVKQRQVYDSSPII